jgi:hypothetical protein
MLPVWFTPEIAEMVFEDLDTELEFSAWAGVLYSLRAFF